MALCQTQQRVVELDLLDKKLLRVPLALVYLLLTPEVKVLKRLQFLLDADNFLATQIICLLPEALIIMLPKMTDANVNLLDTCLFVD